MSRSDPWEGCGGSLDGLELLRPAPCKGPPVGPPNQWCRSLSDPHPYDVVTGDPRIDKQISISRGLYPKPWWRRIFGGRES